MLRELVHPVTLKGYNSPFLFKKLVVTWVELGSKYWVDLIDTQARMRLTNVKTGQYVIFGRPGALHSGLLLPDELLHNNVPGPMLRAYKRETNTFITFDAPSFKDFPVMAISRTDNFGVYIYEDAGGVTYDITSVNETEKLRIRTLQQDKIHDEIEWRHLVRQTSFDMFVA